MTTSMGVLIAGPTASGKSALAVELAERLGGTVVNADAMQVYADLHILTARPDRTEEAHVPHALYGAVDASVAYSVASWLEAARAALAEAAAAGRPAIIVGGTGLYLAALTEGLSSVPPVPDAVRDHWRAAQATLSSAALHALLEQRDPAMAALLAATDPQRVVRALEVWEATGRSLADWQAAREPPLLSEVDTVARLVIAPPRDALRARIAERFMTMIDAGAVDEAVTLSQRNLDPNLPAMKAIGVKHLAAYGAGRLDRADAMARAINETRQYAKRQETWFRNRFAHWTTVADPRDAPNLILRQS